MTPRLASAALGIWLMAAPDVLGYAAAPAVVARIVGPLAFTFAIVAITEATRPLRWVNAALAVVLLVAILVDHSARAAVNHALVAGALAVLARIRGPVRERLGGGWSAVWSERPEAR